jgi:ubiquinone/menaquinone biosynthesis C-methylase UbiE
MSSPSTTPSNSSDAVRELVRQHYSDRVRSGTGCCDSTASQYGDSQVALYSTDELGTIPSEAAEFSMGCGNPTLIASLQPGEVVLDLGSGGGIDVLLAARQVGADGFVYGVDMTDDMLELARRNAAKIGATNVEFRKGHIEDIPLPDATIDVIMSNCVVNLSPDKGQVLGESFRVLRPGGRLAISDIIIDGDLRDLPVSEEQVRTALSWAGCIAGALTKQEYLALLNAAGFEAVDVSIKQHYTLEALGQDMESAARLLPPEVVHALVQRFASASITARKPGA